MWQLRKFSFTPRAGTHDQTITPPGLVPGHARAGSRHHQLISPPILGTLNLGVDALEVRSDLTNTDTRRPGTSPFTSSGAADPLRTPGGATRYRVLVN